jgi:hypothetical protein
VITTDRQTAIEKAVLNLDALDDISALTTLLIPVVGSALDDGPEKTGLKLPVR